MNRQVAPGIHIRSRLRQLKNCTDNQLQNRTRTHLLEDLSLALQKNPHFLNFLMRHLHSVLAIHVELLENRELFATFFHKKS